MEIRVCSEISRKEMPRSSRASRNFSPIVMAISKRSRLFCVDHGDAQLARRLLPGNSHLIPGRIARNFKPQNKAGCLRRNITLPAKVVKLLYLQKVAPVLILAAGGGSLRCLLKPQ